MCSTSCTVARTSRGGFVSACCARRSTHTCDASYACCMCMCMIHTSTSIRNI
jgi:hypothetical protein